MMEDSNILDKPVSEILKNWYTSLKSGGATAVNYLSRDSVKNFGKFSLKALIPGLVVGALATGVYTKGKCFNPSYSPNQIVGIEEKQIENSQYTVIAQESGRRTEFLKDGDTGRRLEDIEAEKSKKLAEKYEAERKRLEGDYDKLKQIAIKKAEEVWK